MVILRTNLLIYIEMDRADPNPKQLHANQDFLNNESHSDHASPNGNTTLGEHNDDDDGGDVDGPTVEAHIDLAKIACEFYITQSCRNILTYLYSVPRLSQSYCC